MRQNSKYVYIFAILFLAVSCILAFRYVGHASDNKVKVENKEYRQKYRNQRGSIVYRVNYQYPFVQGEYDGVPSINDFFEKQKDSFILSQKDIIQYVTSLYEVLPEPYTNEVMSQVTYNQNGLLSVLQEGYQYTGGAHGISTRNGYVFDLSSGERLPISRLWNESPEMMKEKIETAFMKMIEENKTDYWNDAETIIRNTKLEDYQFYLTNKGLVVYFPPYELAPYIRGFVDIKLPIF